ncbi:hypothetical protein MIND_00961500 [Mycena indigotica]|uniref:BTB domain-containing protein n=1 Tax=Mycena indigotica TaxID=2126181 RepID=A0A8H6SD61_9AGAR|nr:uncharacterized protein MIND_00961500 [Mycena indigotica]KAF7297283.1 hypothetical protein MIND_00961500 [Mycena indigotica]
MSLTCTTLSMADIEGSPDSTRSLKRRRFSRPPSSDPLPLLTTALDFSDGLSRGTIHKTFWFPDGDFVLEIEQRLLKVHRKRLLCSAVFADMLSLPQPPPAELDRVDGCPSVALFGDALADWEVVLRWIYQNAEILAQGQGVTFDTLASTLRISTKYDIPDLREWGVKQLKARWPVDAVNMRAHALPHAAEAITLAHECQVPEILPSAFYALSVQKFHGCGDGGRSHLVLSPLDLRRLLAGREALQDALVRIIIDPLTEPNCYSNDSCRQCTPFRSEYWRKKLTPDAKAPWNTWLIRELEIMQDDEAFMDTLCTDCRHAHATTVRWRLGKLRGSLSTYFQL